MAYFSHNGERADNTDEDGNFDGTGSPPINHPNFFDDTCHARGKTDATL